MPEDAFFMGGDYRFIDDGNSLDTWSVDELKERGLGDETSTPVHQISLNGDLYELDAKQTAERDAVEKELRVLLSEGDNFKLHLG